MTVGYQAWNHFGAEGVWTTSELVVAASGAEARVVGTAGGSGYQGAVFVPHQSGVKHTSRETWLRGSLLVCGEVTASPKTRWVYGEVLETSGCRRGVPPFAGLFVRLGPRITLPAGCACQRGLELEDVPMVPSP